MTTFQYWAVVLGAAACGCLYGIGKAVESLRGQLWESAQSLDAIRRIFIDHYECLDRISKSLETPEQKAASQRLWDEIAERKRVEAERAQNAK